MINLKPKSVWKKKHPFLKLMRLETSLIRYLIFDFIFSGYMCSYQLVFYLGPDPLDKRYRVSLLILEYLNLKCSKCSNLGCSNLKSPFSPKSLALWSRMFSARLGDARRWGAFRAPVLGPGKKFDRSIYFIIFCFSGISFGLGKCFYHCFTTRLDLIFNFKPTGTFCFVFVDLFWVNGNGAWYILD